MNKVNRRGYLKYRKAWIVLFAIYLALIFVSINVFIAEDSIDDIRTNMDEKYTYHLTYTTDGQTTHYDVLRHNSDIPGIITLTYWTQDNKLDISKVENIKTLKIDVLSMFEDESMKVFKKSHSSSKDLHMKYWLEAGDGVFTIEFNIAESEPMESLTFTNFPEPKSVRVNNQEWWKTNTNFQKADEEIIISDIPTGKTTVIMYFKEANRLPVAIFSTNPSSYADVNENITFDASSSTDPDGNIVSWVWTLGDGLQDSGQSVVHKYSTPGTYTIRLTVRDDATPFGENWIEKNITVDFGAQDDFDGDNLLDIWEWDNFGEDVNPNDDPDEDGATNKQEHDADTDPNNLDSKPSLSGPSEKGGDGADYTLAIIAIIIVVIAILVLMMVLRSKKSKDKVKTDSEEVYEVEPLDEGDKEEIAKMEMQIRRAKKMGLPTGDLEKLLEEARGDSSSKGRRTSQSLKTGTKGTRTGGTTWSQQSKGRSRSGRGNRGDTKTSRKR